MSSCNLSCPDCRVRVRARAKDIALLEGNCPICGATLRFSSASEALGLRLFDLDALSEQDGSSPPASPGTPVDLVARHAAASARSAVDAEYGSDDGSSVNSAAVAARLPAH